MSDNKNESEILVTLERHSTQLSHVEKTLGSIESSLNDSATQTNKLLHQMHRDFVKLNTIQAGIIADQARTDEKILRIEGRVEKLLKCAAINEKGSEETRKELDRVKGFGVKLITVLVVSVIGVIVKFIFSTMPPPGT